MTVPPEAARPPSEDAARRAAQARWHFLLIGLVRLCGAAILLMGMTISLQRFGWIPGDKARWIGLIVSAIGLVLFVIVPRMLARAFATPRDRR